MDLEREYLRAARQKARVVRSYFDDDGDDDSPRSHARDSAGSERSNGGGAASGAGSDTAEIDPLDAFMMGIDAQVSQERAQASASKKPEEKPSRFEDDHDSYLEELARSHKKARPTGSEFADSDDEVYATARQVDGDSDDNGENDRSKKTIEPLAPLEHGSISYESFRKCFYTAHPAVVAMSEDDVRALRQELSIATDGSDVPRAIRSFMEAGFDRKMLGQLMKLGLEAPTPIQAQAFPIAMSGRDMIGIAKTGSGKTLAFTLPMVVHVMDQRELKKDEGPIAIVLSPTRELAHQIFTQAKKFLTVYGAQCAAIYGGVGKWDQIQALRKGAEVVVATPGRLIDMIRKKNVRTNRVTFVVLDEADRMFEMGFEPQLRSIMGQIRPDRQTLMFSATFRKRVEALARDVLQNPVKITVGKIGQANEDIHQIAVVLNNHQAKWPWLMANLKKIAAEGRVLIFAGSKVGCEELTKNLNALQYKSNCLHGDKTQQERNEALAKFKSGECSILVATDVAARGLDVKDVKTVVNYDTAKNIDTHTHRIGRTGRMGTEGFEPGTAYTLVTRSETQFAAQLVQNMDVSGQQVMADLLAIAKHDPQFRRGTPSRNGPRMGAPRRKEVDLPGRESQAELLDEEDEEEMKRWNDTQRKTKADRRKGLGFAPGIGGATSNRGFQMTFVKGLSQSAPPQQPLIPGFVKGSIPTTTPPPQPPPSQVPPLAFGTAPSLQPPPPPPPRLFFGAGVAGSSLDHRPPPPSSEQLARIPPHAKQFQASVQPPVIATSHPNPPVISQQPTAAATSIDAIVTRGRQPDDSSSQSRRRSPSSSPDRRRARRSRSRSRASSNRSSRSRYRSRSRSHSGERHSYSRRRRSPSRSRSRSRGRYRR